MVVARRTFSVPGGAEARVYSVNPGIDTENERVASRNLRILNGDFARYGIPTFDVNGM